MLDLTTIILYRRIWINVSIHRTIWNHPPSSLYRKKRGSEWAIRMGQLTGSFRKETSISQMGGMMATLLVLQNIRETKHILENERTGLV